jgi:hypothetical protein
MAISGAAVFLRMVWLPQKTQETFTVQVQDVEARGVTIQDRKHQHFQPVMRMLNAALMQIAVTVRQADFQASDESKIEFFRVEILRNNHAGKVAFNIPIGGDNDMSESRLDRLHASAAHAHQISAKGG